MKQVSSDNIKKAVKVLQQGGVVLFPTETSYGLAADATNAKAVAKVAKMKGRPSEKTFPLIVASTAMAERYAHLRCLGHRLAKEYWPGPLTLVVEARKGSGLSRGVIGKDGTIALRVSADETARALSRGLGAPVVSTSANRAGEPAAFVVSDMNLDVDFILDAGRLPKRKPSTIVSLTDGRIRTLRHGNLYIRRDL